MTIEKLQALYLRVKTTLAPDRELEFTLAEALGDGAYAAITSSLDACCALIFRLDPTVGMMTQFEPNYLDDRSLYMATIRRGLTYYDEEHVCSLPLACVLAILSWRIDLLRNPPRTAQSVQESSEPGAH